MGGVGDVNAGRAKKTLVRGERRVEAYERVRLARLVIDSYAISVCYERMTSRWALMVMAFCVVLTTPEDSARRYSLACAFLWDIDGPIMGWSRPPPNGDTPWVPKTPKKEGWP